MSNDNSGQSPKYVRKPNYDDPVDYLTPPQGLIPASPTVPPGRKLVISVSAAVFGHHEPTRCIAREEFSFEVRI